MNVYSECSNARRAGIFRSTFGKRNSFRSRCFSAESGSFWKALCPSFWGERKRNRFASMRWRATQIRRTSSGIFITTQRMDQCSLTFKDSAHVNGTVFKHSEATELSDSCVANSGNLLGTPAEHRSSLSRTRSQSFNQDLHTQSRGNYIRSSLDDFIIIQLS